VLQKFTGQVLGLDGKPAIGVTVTGLISNNGGGLLSNNGSSYRVLQANSLTATTDAEGRFKLDLPAGEKFNIEAVQNADTKAIQLEVAAGAQELTLKLAPTGTISGKVTAPNAPSVTNFEGVDVFIPGTSYSARAAKDGSFTISNVPAGTFTLVALNTGLGRAEAVGVKVESKLTTANTALAFSTADLLPSITSVSQANGGPGTKVTIKGANFGASKASLFKVKFGSIDAVTVTRKSDTEIEAEVPEGGGSAGIIVEVAGQASAPAAFKVLKTLTIKNAPNRVLINKPVTLSFEAKDSADAVVANPVLKWEVIDGAATIDQTGIVTPTGAGTVQVQVSSGLTKIGARLTVVATEAELGGNEDMYLDSAGVTLTPSGQLYMSSDVAIYKLDNDNVYSLFAGDPEAEEGEFSSIVGLAADISGNLYVADDSAIKKISAAGVVTNFAGLSGTYAVKDGVGAAARFEWPSAITCDLAGNVYVVDEGENGTKLRKIAPNATVTTLAGTYDGSELKLAADASGNVYVSEGATVHKISAAGTRTTFATVPNGDEWGSGLPIAAGPDGKIYVISEGKLYGISAAGQVAEVAATGLDALSSPVNMAFDALGRLRVADSGENRVITVTLP
jgi:hypothetical protein